MSFSFRLQKVLDYRHNVVDELVMNVALAEQRLHDAQMQLIALREEERIGNRVLLEQQRGGARISDVVVVVQQMELLRRRILAQAATVSRCADEVDEARQLIVQANRDQKALENLKGRQEAEYRAEARRQEQVVTSEMASDMRRRRISAGF